MKRTHIILALALTLSLLAGCAAQPKGEYRDRQRHKNCVQ